MLMRTSVHAALRDDIIACRLLPGAELREPELAARYHAGRSPLRDALLRLEAEGLVRIVPRQFHRVAPISLADAADLFGMRRLLEPEAARALARSRDPEVLAALAAAAEPPPEADFIDANRAFHTALAHGAANRRLTAAIIACVEQSDRLVRVSLGQMEGRQPDGLVAQHRAILAAIREGDGRAAARLLRAHIDAGETRVLAALRRERRVID